MKRAIVFGMLMVGSVGRGDETLPVAATAGKPGSMVVFAVMGRTIFPVGCWDAVEQRSGGNMSCVPLNKAGDEVQLDGGERVKIAEMTRMYAGREVDPVPAWRIDRAVEGARWGVWPPAAMARTRVELAKGRREVVGLNLDGRGFDAQLLVWEKGRKRVVNWKVVKGDAGILGGYSR